MLLGILADLHGTAKKISIYDVISHLFIKSLTKFEYSQTEDGKVIRIYQNVHHHLCRIVFTNCVIAIPVTQYNL